MRRVNDILEFWFGEITNMDAYPEDKGPLWFKKDPSMDARIKENFEADVIAAANGEYDAWLENSKGQLAQIILFDQFCRNIFRGEAKSFANDKLALKITTTGVENGVDKDLPLVYRCFFYMPLMHSENKDVQNLSIQKFAKLAEDASEEQKSIYNNFLDYAHKHKAIIDQFGRYPHRNEVLGRTSTTEEIKFLKTPGSSF